MQYLSFACLQIGEQTPNIGPVLAKAVREDFSSLLDELSVRFLEHGEEFQRRALDLETPNRVRFAKTLYDGYPYLLASRQLARCLIDLLPPSTADTRWAKTFRVADERSVRFVDGMIDQWADLGDGRLRRERQQVLEAQAAGDRRMVNKILSAGEQALRRPRSVREYLLGRTSDRKGTGEE